MFYFRIGDIHMSTALDWLGLGFSPHSDGHVSVSSFGEFALKSIVSYLGEEYSESKNPYYQKSFKGNGWSFSYNPKPGVSNPPYCLEIRGSFFSSGFVESQLNEVFHLFYDAGCLSIPYRIDCCIDFFRSFDPSRLKISSKLMKKSLGYFLDGEKQCSGFWAGRGDLRYRFYNKKLEQESSGKEVKLAHWWRWEVQCRGVRLKSQFPEIPGQFFYRDFWHLGLLFLSNKKTLQVSPSIIQDAATELLAGDLLSTKKKKSTWEGSMRWFYREMELRVSKFRENLIRRFPKTLMNWAGEEPIDETCTLKTFWDDDE